jgi:hypothetical protein
MAALNLQMPGHQNAAQLNPTDRKTMQVCCLLLSAGKILFEK